MIKGEGKTMEQTVLNPETIEQNTAEEVVYRKARKWQMALGMMNNGASMCFFMLMMYASYIGSAGYGVGTALLGLIITGTRIFDGITDPIIAFLIDKTNTGVGKIRIWLAGGWLVEAIAVILMINVLSGRGFGVLMYSTIYALYIIGYTMNSIAGNIIPTVMVTDPRQRPIVGVFGTIYSYFVPMIVTILINVVILPKFENQYSIPMLQTASLVILAVSLVFMILCCIGITPIDKMENFTSTTAEPEKVRLRDAIKLVTSSRALLTFIIGAAADKFAQQTAGQAVITTMLSGILIGNMQIATKISVYAMVPSIVFAFLGAKYAGRHGSRQSMITWSWACVAVLAPMYIWLSLIDMRTISLATLPMIGYTLASLAKNGTMMCVTTTNTMMLSDIVDFEHARTGNYLPATITGTYSFVDKLISSFGATVASFAIALIGFTSTLPQPTDDPTPEIKFVALFLTFGLPILGRLCAIVAMKFNPITKESMIEAHRVIQERAEAGAQ
jgi:Na+/melibiose symporter and related transporters